MTGRMGRNDIIAAIFGLQVRNLVPQSGGAVGGWKAFGRTLIRVGILFNLVAPGRFNWQVRLPSCTLRYLVQQADEVDQCANIAQADLFGVGDEMVVDPGFQSLRHPIDLNLGGQEGVEGFGSVDGAAGGHRKSQKGIFIAMLQSE
ncbi:hypothetical protein [Cypionkella psychrotolerans]|uniref:hypothetical protein n=1 Tax=Cypionkella psychrotolerans TaxID=1678131 RepID=UPI0012E0CA5B|nr:hypothetical protein [Cypionkella psychrotolerans]